MLEVMYYRPNEYQLLQAVVVIEQQNMKIMKLIKVLVAVLLLITITQQACHYTCNICDVHESETGCSDCDDAVTFRGLTASYSCECKVGYGDTGSKICSTLSCDVQCETCQHTASTCISCKSSDYREINGNTCPCQPGYYHNNVALCPQCAEKCVTCTTTATTCGSCNSVDHHRQHTGGNDCVCSVGYFELSGETICQACAHQCATCTTSSTNCTTCKTSTPVRTTQPDCECSGRFFDDGSQDECQACDHSCQTCSDLGSCTSCSDPGNRVTSSATTKCVCKANFYDDGTSQDCKPCDATCLTCIDGTSIKCITCDGITKFRIFNSVTTACDCKVKYYNNDQNVCTPCDSTCKTCSGPAGTQCLTCDPNAKRIKSSTQMSCLCFDGYYSDAGKICRVCHSSCRICSAFTICTGCIVAEETTLANGKCQCTTSQFWNITTSTCQSCNYKCLTCSVSATNCTLCPFSSNRLYSPSAHTCQCAQYFYQVTPDTVTCGTCDITCATCNGSGCLTCSTSNHRNIIGVTCPCINGYYPATSPARLCETCHYSCNKCTDGNICTQCNSIELRVTGTDNLCHCKDKYYEDPDTLKCKACLYHCKTCTAEDQCTTCQSSTNFRQLNSASTLCKCKQKYYDDGIHEQCLSCLYDCLTCTSGTKCITCDSTAFRTLNTVTYRCPCNTKYFQSSTTCTPCDRTCATCTTTATTCSSCNTTAFRYKTGSTCPCKVGYYDDATKEECKKCHYSCQTCIDGSTCTTCDSGTLRTVSSANSGPCICPTQKYYDDGSSKACKSCLYNCLTCTDITSCASCNFTKSREPDSNAIYCKCSDKFYDDGLLNQQCKTCDYKCSKCTNSTTCLTCDIGTNFRHLPDQICPCIDRYYTVSLNPICQTCQYTCKTCTNVSVCTSCDTLKFRSYHSATKLCICLTKYFNDGTNQLCLPCDYTCKTCSSTATTCVTCNAAANRQKVSNACPCKKYFYDDLSNQLCKPCHYTCKTCSDSSTCDSCDGGVKFRETDPDTDLCRCMQGYYNNGQNQQCVKCQDSCLECISGTACTDCDSALNRQLNSTVNYLGITSPLCVCIFGYYSPVDTSTACVICHISCEVCSGPNDNNCLLCQAGKQRTLSSDKKCLCNAGFYDDGTGQQCQLCDYTCKTCQTDNTQCKSCQTTSHRTLSSDICPCDIQYYDDLTNTLCLPCNYACASCTDQTSCVTCDGTKNRQNHSPYCSCKEGYYDDGSAQICPECHASCLDCTIATSCSTCDDARNRELNSTANYAEVTSQFCICSYGYYDLGAALDCAICDYSCQVCSGPASTNCLHCDSLAHRIFDTQAKTCLCSDGYYDNTGASQQTCIICHQRCTKCTDGTFTTCAACATPFYLLQSTTTCFDTCPITYFNHLQTYKCKPCSSDCEICTDTTHCTRCEAGKPLYQDKCLAVCPSQSTFIDAANNKCIDCPTGCLTCSSSNQCLTCKTDYYLDILVPLCFDCNKFCKGCFGPASNQCEDCQYPLYFKTNQCFNISCPYGQYVHSRRGCVDCFETFPNSLTCSITSALLCKQNYKLSNSQCLQCSQVTGYRLTSTLDCSQICGDGLLFQHQCDDGNKINGDGCASNCITQQGWNCVTVSNQQSVCQLTGDVILDLQKISKYGGKNKATFQFDLNMQIKLNMSSFNILIDSSIDNFTWIGSQNQKNLKELTIEIQYSVDISKKFISIVYGETINRRLLFQLSFSNDFEIDSFPPALYYSSEQVLQFQIMSDAIEILAIILMCVCAACLIFPRRMYMNLFTYSCIPAQLYIAYGLIAESDTDWIKSGLQNLKYTSLIFGFDLYQCCTTIQFFGYSTKIPANAGIILAIVFGLWLGYGFLIIISKNFCQINPKVNMYTRNIIITLQLCTLPHLTFSAVNSLYNFSINFGENPINVCVGIFINIYIFAFIAGLWVLSYSLQTIQYEDDEPVNIGQAEQQQQQGRIKNSKVYLVFDTKTHGSGESIMNDTGKEFFNLQSHRSNKIGDSSTLININRKNDEKQDNHKLTTAQSSMYRQIQEKYQKQWLIYDYVEEYESSRRFSKYFLAYAATKIYLFSLIASVAQNNLIVVFSLLLANQIFYTVFLLIVRPFRLRYTTAKHLILEFVLISLNCVMIAYVILASRAEYYSQIQYAILVIIACLLGIAIAFLILDVFAAWRFQIWNRIQPCLVALRIRNPRKVFDQAQQFNKPLRKIRKIDIRDVAIVESIPKEDESTGNKQEGVVVEKEEEVAVVEKEQLEAFYARMLKKQKLQRKYRKQRFLKNGRINLQ